ncbi:hypothetical protein QF025_004094 [Paraburkholderia graminis]|uniref:Uncharacterized protein n=1 Tax=Paraburkholderia graminis TaxID=60548 RepID=A0ABD5CJK0_9BURK|nr:hypothetical protein [Paraburkholderia graminis]
MACVKQTENPQHPSSAYYEQTSWTALKFQTVTPIRKQKL